MLIFFIHGVAESKVKFAKPLQSLIKQDFSQRGHNLPHFHSGFYADILNTKDRIWNFIHQDLANTKQENPHVDTQDIFRGQEIRQEFISDFVGDAFTYLNIERGAKIREAITLHLNELIQDYPDENELHIVAHSMGTVILWDMLFSDKFSSGDSVFMFRELINDRVKLKSITTMGSPILLFNMILDIKKHQIHDFMSDFTQQNLRWTNIIHASDLIAYPLGASLKINNVPDLLIKDKFISTSANDLETTVRAVAAFPAVEAASKINANINQVLYMASLASGAADAHINYWHCPQTAKIIVDNILGSEEKIINVVIERLKRVSGMTILLVENEDSAQVVDSQNANYWDMYFGNIDKLRESFEFCDGSGKLRMRDNLAQIPHVSVYNSEGNCQFKGYVGLIHANGLRTEVEDIKKKYY